MTAEIQMKWSHAENITAVVEFLDHEKLLISAKPHARLRPRPRCNRVIALSRTRRCSGGITRSAALPKSTHRATRRN
jgi:hypothetical protein